MGKYESKLHSKKQSTMCPTLNRKTSGKSENGREGIQNMSRKHLKKVLADQEDHFYNAKEFNIIAIKLLAVSVFGELP